MFECMTEALERFLRIYGYWLKIIKGIGEKIKVLLGIYRDTKLSEVGQMFGKFSHFCLVICIGILFKIVKGI